ncbi:exported hypothetical protein [Candidatus Sulfotelmatobacter kueseliae]|uniref:Uncharacterized protein n=1 Tax=Candidatus Sulfotelmatobacter kueseliae TaxID=2042962 RepID=A0A2U3KS43_9BACT|nr:exported hypothetical protein [Candidatus Sulfotelmatobacter kueseliae]
MKACALFLVILSIASSAQEKKTQPENLSAVFHNERLKVLTLKDSPIIGNDHLRLVSGIWVPETVPRQRKWDRLRPEVKLHI